MCFIATESCRKKSQKSTNKNSNLNNFHINVDLLYVHVLIVLINEIFISGKQYKDEALLELPSDFTEGLNRKKMVVY